MAPHNLPWKQTIRYNAYILFHQYFCGVAWNKCSFSVLQNLIVASSLYFWWNLIAVVFPWTLLGNSLRLQLPLYLCVYVPGVRNFFELVVHNNSSGVFSWSIFFLHSQIRPARYQGALSHLLCWLHVTAPCSLYVLLYEMCLLSWLTIDIWQLVFQCCPHCLCFLWDLERILLRYLP